MAYTIERIRAEFTQVCNKAGVEVTSPIELNGRLVKTLGRVCAISYGGRVENKKVEFSKQLLATATDASIEAVLKHEAAHYIANARTHESHGHDSYFRQICAEIGTDNDGTTTDVERTVSNDKIYKYTIYCETCQEPIAYYHRMSKTLKNLSSCSCKQCGTHNLKLIQNY